MKLKELADIKSGYPFRYKLQNDKSGNVNVIQLRNIDAFGKIDYNNIGKINFKVTNNKIFLNKGDVLFKAKSNKKTAVYLDQNINNLLATSHFFILTVQNPIILPEYLTWFLNQKIAQRYFESCSGGSFIPIVNKSNLEHLKIYIPSKDIQQKIINIHNLRLFEKQLIIKIEDKKEKLIEKRLLDLIKK